MTDPNEEASKIADALANVAASYHGAGAEPLEVAIGMTGRGSAMLAAIFGPEATVDMLRNLARDMEKWPS